MKPRMELFSLREEIRKLDAAWDEVVVEGEHGSAEDEGRKLSVLAEMKGLLVENLAALAVDLFRWAEEKDDLAEALDRQSKLFHDAAKMVQARAIRAREALLEAMLEQGMSEIEGENLTLKIQNGPPAVVQTYDYDALEILDLPDQYLRFKAPELNRTAIKDALKAGQEVPGFTLASRPTLRARVRS